MPTLTFCGAAGTVTGSSSLIKTDSTQFLIDSWASEMCTLLLTTMALTVCCPLERTLQKLL